MIKNMNDATQEEIALGLAGLGNHSAEAIADDYFSRNKEKHISLENDKNCLLEIKTFGFKDGVLVHNMPCPVCLKRMANYVSNDDDSYFAPCGVCSANGYVLEKKSYIKSSDNDIDKNKKKKGWF